MERDRIRNGFDVLNNPRLILETLDRHLNEPVELTIFGRSALVLGFPNPPPGFETTCDVDAILPLQWLAAENENADFWLAQQKTNAELAPRGLYITHLFRETEIILSPDWWTRRTPLKLSFQKLRVFRPATLDLVLTKMMRADEDDLKDIRFLLQTEKLRREELMAAFECARVPGVPEIHELFRAAQPKVLRIAQEVRQ